jgi:8-oxo-dGTP pyrophosphatase MutT (NUDIX family)
VSGIEVVRLAGLAARRLDEPWPWAERNRRLVEAHWAALTADNPALYNGRVLVRRRHDLCDGRLDLGYVETDYASFIAFRDHGFPDPGTGNAFAMAALRGADGAFLLGRMGEHTANAGKVYFPAGTPGPEDVLPDGTVDLAGSILRELEEETGLAPADVVMDEPWTATLAGARTALMREVRAPEPAQALRERIRAFLAGQARPELSDIVIVRTASDIDESMPPFMGAYLRAVLQR